MTATIRKYIKYNVAYLKVLGLWTEEGENSISGYHWMYRIFINVFCIGLLNLAQLLYLVSAINDLEEFVSSAYLFITCAMANVKMYFFCQHFALFKSILFRLDQKDFQPRNERQWNKVHEFMRVHVICQIFFFSSFCLAMVLWLISPLVVSKDTTLPFKAWYPFDEKENQALFVLAYVHQSIGVVFIGLANMLVDLVTVGLIAYVAVECDILADTLEHLREFTKARLSEEATVNVQEHKIGEEMNETLLSCVRFHWKILKLAEDTNQIFNMYTFILFANSLLGICLTMFQMNVFVFGSTEMYMLVLVQLSVFNELLMYCWFGNQLIAKSEKISYALYESDWVDCSKMFKKNMVFVMLRTSQRPINMFVLNFFALSLATFTYILRASWSFFAMLNQVRRRNM